MNGSPKTLNNSIAKAFALLEEFSHSKKEWGVRELSQKLDANASTTYRLMATLESLGVLRKNPQTEKYSLGLKLFELGHRVAIQDALLSVTRPELEKVAEEITETVHLGIFQNQQVFVVDKVESPKGLKLNSSMGAYMPAYCTSIGKVLLAHLAEEQLKIYLQNLPLKSWTPYTLTDKAQLKDQLRGIRIQGFAYDRQEYEIGLTCVAVPVYNQNQQLIASLSAAGPEIRFREEALGDYVGILKKGATAIQNKIGNFKP